MTARLTLDWLLVVALLGAVQGIFLAGVLATKRTNRAANRLLAGLMLAFSVSLTTTVYHATGYVRIFPHFFGLSYPLPFVFGPLVYRYAVTVADRDRSLTWRDALHFLPFTAVVLAGLPIYLMSGAEKVALFDQLQRGEIPLLLRIVDPFKLVSGLGYAAATILFLQDHRDRVKESYSSLERVNLRWLLWLGVSAAAIWVMAMGFQLLDAAGIVRVARADDFVSLAIAVMVYAIGYRGLRQPEIFRYETAEHAIPAEALLAARRASGKTVAATEAAEPNTAPRYERSGLTQREAERLKEALTAAMERERPWRNADLTLADLAGQLSTTPHKLSEVLNAQIGQTFYDFVNGYRVREVQRRIAAGDARDVTILSLALDAGFASKSTFNDVFKKHTSQTPSDYRQATGN